MKQLMCLVVALILPLSLPAQKVKKEKKEKFDASKMVGKWSYVSGKRAGKAVPKDHLVGTVTITKDMMTIPGGPDATFKMAYKVNAKTNPATIDIEIKDGPVKEGKAKGLIKMKGDQLILCYVPAPGEAPKKMESTEKNNAFYFVLKRQK